MIRTFGKMPASPPPGFFKAVHFPVLARLDVTTGDRRRLVSEGGTTRDLPLTIRYAKKASYGHDGAIVSGTLFQVTFDPDNGVLSGDGYLLNDENGRDHARLIYLQAMRGNSVDLAEVKARYVEDMEKDDYWVEFYEWSLAATTGVATPAFADARAELPDGLTDDELMASFAAEPNTPLVVTPEEFYIHIEGQGEITASAATTLTVPFDDFFIPEADHPVKITVDASGRVFGHLALWESCHDGYADQCILVPRPLDSYASFNKPGPLTEHGQVETGPIFAYGGHRSAKSARTIEEAYGGIENAWADVRVIPGKHGPWVSGRVRPGVDEQTVYAARASRISGHWVDGRLKAIVSVNVEGYDVPGTGRDPLVTGFHFSNTGGVTELVASLPGCVQEHAGIRNELSIVVPDGVDVAAFGAAIQAALEQVGLAAAADAPAAEPEAAGDEDDSWADALLARLLETEDEDS